jgi:hydrogenase maturation protease
VSRILVAGIGNVFLGDDGFGVEVAARLGTAGLPAGVEVGDFGIAGIHLAFQLLDGYRAAVLVDAVRRGGRPGDLYLLEVEDGAGPESGAAIDAHGMQPEAVLAMLETLGGSVGRVLVVGCEPEQVEEGMGLSPAVAAAVDPAVAMIRDLVDELSGIGMEQGRRR